MANQNELATLGTPSVASIDSLLLIGCGKMGGALLDGWIHGGLAPERIYVVDPGLTPSDLPDGCHLCQTQSDLPEPLTPDVAILAIKPQLMDDVLPEYVARLSDSLIISIAAGKNVAYFERLFGESCALVRVMPNTPASVGRGISALVGNAQITDIHHALANVLMQAVGDVVWLEGEHQMNAATAVSGSGPAYVFHMIEAMAAAGVAHGLSADVAQKLARATVCGAGELAFQSTEAANVLRQNVTSKGGTTAEALRVLMQDADGLTQLMTRAVAANIQRSEELAE